MATPFIVSYLGSLVRRWEARGSEVIIELSSKISRIAFYIKPIGFGFGEHEAVFVGFYTVVPPESMDENKSELYRRLKPLECELRWEGLIRRKPYWKPFVGLEILRKKIGLKPESLLSDALMSDPEINRLIRKVKPEEAWVALDSGVSHIAGGVENTESAAVEYFRNPEEVKFVMYVSKLCEVAMISKEDTIDILRFMVRIAEEIDNIVGGVG